MGRHSCLPAIVLVLVLVLDSPLHHEEHEQGAGVRGKVSRRGAVARRRGFRGQGSGFKESSTLNTWEILTEEMRRYEYQIRPAGQISYGALSEHHDDCVMALALANHGKWQAENCCVQIFRIQSRRMDGVRRRKAERGAW